MRFQITSLRESLVTLVAGKRLLSCMGEYVWFDVTFMSESLVTLLAGILLFSRMG